MVKVLEIEDEFSGRKLGTEYQNEIFRWLQNPVQPEPKLHIGHRAVMAAAFEATTLYQVANRVDLIQTPEGKTASRLLVAGVNYDDVEASDIDKNLSSTLESLGIRAFPNMYMRRMGVIATNYADVFSQQNYAANEMYLWLKRQSSHTPTAIHGLSQHRINMFIKKNDVVEARKTLDKVPLEDSELVAQLLAGFRANVILSSFSKEDVQQVGESIRKTIWKRYSIPAQNSKDKVTNVVMNERGLRRLKPDHNWGRKRVCDKDDDGILETRISKSSVDPRARILCGACPVRLYCLQESLDNKSMIVRGGLGPSERAKLFRYMNPLQSEDVSSEREIA